MSIILRPAVKITVLTAIAMLLTVNIAHMLGARINLSNSIPAGLYWLTKRPVAKNEYVIFCPPQNEVFENAFNRGYIQSGFCPGQFGHIMKKVAATAGDTVSSDSSGVYVNNKQLPFSQPYQQDPFNHLLPTWQIHSYTLQSSELLLMTNQSPQSFDARYFGLLKREHIQAVIRPILIFKSYVKEN